MKKNYILKTIKSDMTSRGGFKWKKRGLVVCPDWDPNDECGNGLHGALNGEGDGLLFNWGPDAIWIVAEVDITKGIDLGGKWKFPEARVIYAGDRKSATNLIYEKCGMVACIGGTAKAGHYGAATAGNWGTAKADDYGTAKAGYWGTATAGHYGKATVGYEGIATVDNEGTATAGIYGIINIYYFDDRRRIKTGYIGEGGLKPNVAYKLDGNFNFVEAR